jgi:predicted ATPase
MGIRVNKLLTELNIGLATLESLLKSLGYKEDLLTINTKIPDDIAILVRVLFAKDTDYVKIIKSAADKGVYGIQNKLIPTLKVIGRIDLDAYNNPKGNRPALNRNLNELVAPPPLTYNEEEDFWISELVILSSENNVTRISTGIFEEAQGLPLYSVLIGTNGAGKSMLMKEIVDFFIDLHACAANDKDAKLSPANKGRLKGIKYHIDGINCEVFRLEKNYFVRINGYFYSIKDLRLPSIVACHFGAFDKLPVQKVNGSAQTRYDVPYYRYVGAHVNGNMISSSAIAFRLLFALNEQMNDRQRKNICSILDFIGYDHRISLSYTVVMKSKKDGVVKEDIKKEVDNDNDYDTYSRQEKNELANKLYTFYKNKSSASKTTYDYDIDFDSASSGFLEELQLIYKLKKYRFVNSANVIFHKPGVDVTSEDLSSGEFAMLSTVLSISAAANDSHTLVLLDEPELSLHPNWQMTLIDNLDRALANQVCHLLIATHSHMLVSDLPMKRSAVTQIERAKDGSLNANTIAESTYGWSAEEVLLKVFKTATDRNKYLAEVVGTLLKNIGNNTITAKEVRAQVDFLESVSGNLSDVDPMKKIISTIIDGFAEK